jgi:Fe-S-cluster-containing dehydrogenase component/CRP-like cAMP-binding protein
MPSDARASTTRVAGAAAEPLAERAPLGEDEIRRILELPAFAELGDVDSARSLQLTRLLRNEAQIEPLPAGTVLFRKGDYGTSAYFVLSGALALVTDEASVLVPGGGAAPASRRRRGVFSALAQLWRKARWPEERRTVPPSRWLAGTPRARVDPKAISASGRSRTVRRGDLFGELSALARTPRTATVVALEDSELAELRWQGLRDLRRASPTFRSLVDGVYRARALQTELAGSELLAHLDATALREVEDVTEFLSYGAREWALPYRELSGSEPTERLESEPIVAMQGDPVAGVVLVRSGCGRLTVREGIAERTVGYVNRGDLFGLDELIAGCERGAPEALRSTLRAVGHLDALLIPRSVMERVVLPGLAVERLRGRHASRPQSAPDVDRETALLEFLVDGRLVNGSSAMVIDLERCTRCDDCIRACSATHGGNPRFVRHGPRNGNLMVANACMHCLDPVCMIGCPTGAIQRDPLQGSVLIDDGTCIGCGTCAANCPYDNIRMVELRTPTGALIFDETTGAPMLRATKCDLCIDQRSRPACAYACPHDALSRVDLTKSGDAVRSLLR